jgi:hypothetical protein
MKKKFINGILMAALMFAATSSFVSCKDNIDDDLTDVYARLGEKSSDLQGKINDLQNQINNIKPEIINIENHYDTTINNIYQYIDTTIIKKLDVDIARIDSALKIVNQQLTNNTLAIDEINNELTIIENRLNGVGDSVSILWERVDGLSEQLKTLMDNMLNGALITGVDIEATRNDVVGIVNTPVLQSNGLAAYYGTNDAGIEQFPYAGYDFNVGGTRFAEYLEDYELPDDGYVTFDESDYITDSYANAGQVYFTLNSTDYESLDISKFAKITVENSAGEIAPIELNVRKSSARITWTLGRAYYEETGKESDNGLYVADATIKEEDLDPNHFQIEKFINFEKLKSEIKSRMEDIRKHEGETTDKAYTAYFKNFVREICSIVFDLVHNELTSADYASNMTYSPQKLAFYMEKEDGKLKRVAQTKLNLWTTAVKPLSYNTFWEYENSKQNNWIVESVLERAVSRLALEIRERFGDIGITAKIVGINDVEESVIVEVNGKRETIIVSNAKYMADMKQAVKVNGGLEAVNQKLANLLKTFTLGSVVDKAANRINLYIEKSSDYLTNLINKHLFTRAVAPIIIFEHSTGMDRLCEGMFVNRGIMHAYLTSGTMELLVPAYRKYVALEKDGMLLQSAVLPGNTQSYDFDLTEKGDYKIILSCVDYFGFVVTKKYDVYVK